MTTDFSTALRARLIGVIEITDSQIEALEAHYNRLLFWNRTVNLTTVTDLEKAVERHYCESLFLAHHLGPQGRRIVDIGSGPGFPGFPVAVARPDATVTLVESHQRKAVFLKEVSRPHKNIRVLARRIEEVQDRFDCVVSRAVSYRDLGNNLARLAPQAVLLTGVEEPPAELDFAWNPPMPLPWGDQRYLRIGTVSRETTPNS